MSFNKGSEEGEKKCNHKVLMVHTLLFYFFF